MMSWLPPVSEKSYYCVNREMSLTPTPTARSLSWSSSGATDSSCHLAWSGLQDGQKKMRWESLWPAMFLLSCLQSYQMFSTPGAETLFSNPWIKS